MNISAQRFTTKTRTWLFIAGLTALLIGMSNKGRRKVQLRLFRVPIGQRR